MGRSWQPAALVNAAVSVDEASMETSAAVRPIPGSASDERLVALVRDGSEAAFEMLYDRHLRGILGFCRQLLGSADEAEDAVQHTFMAAYRDLIASDKPIQLRPWLYTIARNRCYTLLRERRGQRLTPADEPATEHLSSAVQRRQDLRDVLADVAALPEDQRAAIVLAGLGAVPHDEIATALAVPRDKVKALVFQGRSSLIASRNARETPCAEIRSELASLRDGRLKRTTLRRHVRECPGCDAFRSEVVAQRRAASLGVDVRAATDAQGRRARRPPALPEDLHRAGRAHARAAAARAPA
jgi:RNA polymerase sigma factor (sigma-70 family)